MTDRWDQHFLRQCLECASMSKDPNTRVGAVIVGPDKEPRSDGFNGFPRGIADTVARLADREVKNSLMVHAEQNAIYNAARVGTSLKGCTMYLACTDDSGQIWGGPPCSTHCTPGLIQVGIVEVVTYPFKEGDSNWRENIEKARRMLLEAGIRYREVPVPGAPA